MTNERFGCEFFKKEDGSMKYVPQRGLDHVKLYPAQLKGRGGELMVKNIVRQLKQRDAARQNSPGECVITSGTSDCTRCKKIAKAGHVPAFFTV